MKLTHTDKDKNGIWTFDPTVKYDNSEAKRKPSGLWLSVDNDWEEWCENEGMEHWIEGDSKEFILLEPDRVLTLTTVDDVLNFSKTITAGITDRRNQYRLPWYTLVDHWAGIMIAPYQWKLRLDERVSWYYTWDCASACIWDLSVIEVKGE